ncbi:FAD-binding oxidoreductase [Streptomyces sp. NA04227]|uniref:FAD-binding oxidoreductase n=1 Tax=Streptomyces sp. NA04227 TaxID=2742136 RepID=UPI0015924C8C|nr:FAD-binding oxidoreductase [Streptomyces sp. NA04227]QKW08080.1 FAD-binding oxidoreductase [Streptomyces sp. NA04227]
MAGHEQGLHRRNFLTGGAAASGAALLAGTGLAGTGLAAPSTAAAADGGPAAEPLATVTPGDKRYQDLVRGYNQRWSAAPEKVCLPVTTEQVRSVVQSAVSAGKRLTVRSGGHCHEDWVFNSQVRVVLDMSRMNKVSYDAARNAVCVEAGSQLLNVYERMYRTWGVTIPGGICFQVGAGGHVSGGGWGLLCRQFGLVIDHLYGVEVVTVAADGTVRAQVATREPDDPNRELWWAHAGGGGGNFGVITRFWFRSPGATGTDPSKLLPQPPAEILLHAVSWPWAELTKDRFTRLVKNWSDWHAAHLEPGTVHDHLFSALWLNHKSSGQIGMVTQVDATVPDARRLLDDFLAAVTAGLDVAYQPMTVHMGEISAMPDLAEPRRMPWFQATRYACTTNPTLNDPSNRSDNKSSYYRTSMPDAHLDEFWTHLTRDDLNNPLANVQLSSFGGRIAAVAEDATAFPHRRAAYKAAWSIWWTDPAAEDLSLRWIREFYHGVYARTGGVPVLNEVTDGCYVNYPDIDLGDPAFNTSGVPWHELYYKDNYARLQQVKQKYDPRDFFRHSQSVRLPGA